MSVWIWSYEGNSKHFNFPKPVHYRSQSMPMSTRWRHFARNRPTKKDTCNRSPTALITMSLLWTHTAGQKTVWPCSHASFNTLDKMWCWETKEAVCRIFSFIYYCEGDNKRKLLCFTSLMFPFPEGKNMVAKILLKRVQL